MNRKHLIIILVSCAVAAVAATAVWYYLRPKQEKEKQENLNEILATDGIGYAEEEIVHADPLMVGRWQNTANPQWHKVYYDDFDEDERLFWGKEWDESEDVLEEDLNYHGNGWFRWEKKGNTLHEYATMDVRDVPIHRAYTIRALTDDSLVYSEPDYKNAVYRFSH